MKKFIVLFLASLIFTQTCVSANISSYFTNKWVNVKKTLSEPYFYRGSIITAVIVLVSFLNYKLKERNSVDVDAGPKTIQFVKDTLLKAGFSKEKVDQLCIKEFPGGSFCSSHNTIYVPFTEEQLERALIYYEMNDNDAPRKELWKERDKSTLRLWSITYGVTEETIYKFWQFSGKPITKKAIPLWRGILIHEMSHVLHYDYARRLLFSIVVLPFLYSFFVTHVYLNKSDSLLYTVLHGCQRNVQLGGITYSLSSHFLSLLFEKYQEYRSDQEIIKRTTDYEILESLAEGHEAFAKVCNIDSSMWFIELLQVHPNSEIRANYFKRAAEKLHREAIPATA